MAENYGRLQLLFVDDAPYTRQLLRELLDNTSWRTADIVESVAAAYRVIQAEPPDLVFTDWQMPGESGLDLIRYIRERPDPLLPVILLTANGDAEHVLRARKAGADDYLVKPVSLSRNTDRVTRVVTKQRPFIVSSVYKGPDWRRVSPPGNGEGQSLDPLPPGTIVLPPAGLLLAKVRREAAAIRDALQRRAEAIAVVRNFGSRTLGL
jgi:DNA-binding response OmpR family regulator